MSTRANISHGSVSMVQTGFNRFTVSYGLQVTTHLTYAQAAKEFGECVMHEASCNGLIDNRTKSEARKAGDTVPYFEGA